MLVEDAVAEAFLNGQAVGQTADPGKAETWKQDAEEPEAGKTDGIEPLEVVLAFPWGSVTVEATLHLGRFDPLEPQRYEGWDALSLEVAHRLQGWSNVSRDHGLVYVQAGRAFVLDNGSTNGTWVREPGGEQDLELTLKQPHPLKEASTIVLDRDQPPLEIRVVSIPREPQTSETTRMRSRN